jgi:pimeloyl-ACP methyl ester carboxylesterase
VWSKLPPAPQAVILLVHGRTWSAVPDFDLQVEGEDKSLMDALVRRGVATYAIDLRGYGATARDTSGWLTPLRAAQDVEAVLRWIAARERGRVPVVLGWSMGALVGQLVAQREPSLLSALVLYGYPRDPGAPPRADRAPASPSRAANTPQAAASDFVTPGSISQAAIDAYVEQALQADPIRADWTALEQLGALDPAAVGVPTLVIHGERDPIAPVAAQARLFTRLGHADRAWVILPGCDHAAHLERCAARFVDAVVGFVLAR